MHDSVLLRPTFFDHFDTVVVDWRYMDSQTPKALAREGRWAYMQSLRTIVDFSSGINLYPDLRLCNNSADDYARSIETIERIIDKMSVLINATTATQYSAQYASDAIITLHRAVENYYSGAQVNADFISSVKRLSTYAMGKNVTLHLRVGALGKPPADLESGREFLEACGSPPNLKLAASSAAMVSAGTSALILQRLATSGQVRTGYSVTLRPTHSLVSHHFNPPTGARHPQNDVLPSCVSHSFVSPSGSQLGMVLASAPVIDPISGQSISNYGPLAGCGSFGNCATNTSAILAQAAEHHILVVVDASLPADLEAHQDAYFDESVALKRISALPFPPPPPLPPPPPPPCGSLQANQTCTLSPPLRAASDGDAGDCYTLGRELCGLCEISGAQGRIVMQCNPSDGSVIADYWKVGGGWAGAYGTMFGHMAASNVPCTKIRVDNQAGVWNISLMYGGAVHSWTSAPKGYLPPASVTSITCSPATRCTPNVAANTSVAFSCVSNA